MKYHFLILLYWLERLKQKKKRLDSKNLIRASGDQKYLDIFRLYPFLQTDFSKIIALFTFILKIIAIKSTEKYIKTNNIESNINNSRIKIDKVKLPKTKKLARPKSDKSKNRKIQLSLNNQILKNQISLKYQILQK